MLTTVIGRNVKCHVCKPCTRITIMVGRVCIIGEAACSYAKASDEMRYLVIHFK